MPSMQDMLEMAELLKVQAIHIEEDRCVRVRNRNSSCVKCESACIRDAISANKNELKIEQAACVNCGCCIAVCPTDALRAIDPNVGQVALNIAKTADRENAMVVFACSRKASRHEGDEQCYVELPCLGHIQESYLLKCASVGLEDIVLVDGDCASCKYGAASQRIDDTVETAIAMIEAVGSDAIITRTSEFPPEVRVSADAGKRNIRGEDRRGIITQTGGYVGHVAMNVARKTIDDKLGTADKPRTLQERLSAGKSGRMPSFEPTRNFDLLDEMQRLCEISGGDVDDLSDKPLKSRHFGDVEIDLEKCSGCGLCVMFCPTEALKHSEYDMPSDPDRKYLEFEASLCTQCMLCRDVCIRQCLEVSPCVDLGELYDFEPKLIEINKPKDKINLLEFKKNRNK